MTTTTYSEPWNCPKCGNKKFKQIEIKDEAFSEHYVNDVGYYKCNNCGHEWSKILEKGFND